MSNMLAGLNEHQLQAVSAPLEHLLVLAGAGSGKTRVLTTRMAWLLQNGALGPRNLLAVTFTNKAAREMMTRLTALLPIDTRGMWVGTFHGLCNRMLRAHAREAGLASGFQILDSADQLAALKRLLKAAGVDDKSCPPRDLQRLINSAKEAGERPKDMQASDARSRQLVGLYQLYQDQCQRENVVDFGELLLRSYELLQREEALREHYQRRFQHILVDEFQDTNVLQYRWLLLLAGAHTPIFAVGDDDQSIYAFRGANVGNMADFEQRHARGNLIRLEQNYRSQGHILDAANALIAHNSARLGKNLWTAAGAGEPLRVYEQPSEQLEAQWLADSVRELISAGTAATEIAILYRSNAQSRPIEHALFSAAVPYKVYGGLRFFERQEIKHVLAYLRLIDNPHDDTSWMRVVNFPTRGIGARTLELLADAAARMTTSLAGAVAFVPGKAGSSLLRFVELMRGLREAAQSLSLPELIEHVLHHSGLLAHYQADRDGRERLENLHELVNAAAAFGAEAELDGYLALQTVAAPARDPAEDEPAWETPLGAFLTHASLEAGDNQAQVGSAAVQLMTVHAAKGLEFDAVFITGLEEGLFPHENSAQEPAGVEEERRLMYVAITRARRALRLSFAQSRMLHGQTRFGAPSRFLQEIPAEHLHWVTPKRAASVARWAGAFSAAHPESLQAAGRAASPRARATTKYVQVGEQSFTIGAQVRHARFGSGVIVALSGSGADAQARIEFPVGTKTLALGVAKLEIA